MDAASNNSVDDIRDLRERVAYAPVSGRHKVYILDEAHMLSTAAWNAFLKTLEEPPPHTIFVLATTEANKVLPTVVDRCHRFDFARPSVPQIAAVLRRVADSEEIAIPDEAAALIARSATGSFRDALGHARAARRLLGQRRSRSTTCSPCSAPPTPTCCSAPSTRSPPATPREALLAAARLAESGRDLGRFFADLEAHARGLMVVQTLGEVPAELRVTPEQDERLAEQAAASAARRRAAARPDRRRAARDEGRRRRPHAARARARQGRRAGPSRGRLLGGARARSSASRAAAPPGARRGRAPSRRRAAPEPAPAPPPPRAAPRRSRASRRWPPPPTRPRHAGGEARRGRAGRPPRPSRRARGGGGPPSPRRGVVEPDATTLEPSSAAVEPRRRVAELWPAVLESRERTPMLAATASGFDRDGWPTGEGEPRKRRPARLPSKRRPRDPLGTATALRVDELRAPRLRRSRPPSWRRRRSALSDEELVDRFKARSSTPRRSSRPRERRP